MLLIVLLVGLISYFWLDLLLHGVLRLCFRNVLSDVSQRTNSIQSQVAGGVAAAGGGGGGAAVDNTYQINEIKNSINNVQNDVRTLASRPAVSLYSNHLLLKCL